MPEKQQLAAVAVIPARWGSTRLPAKVLADLGGKPVVQHVWERCMEAGVFSRVIIATDNDLVVLKARRFGAEALLTDEKHQSGTERVAEIATSLAEPIVVNVQGDEPFVDPEALRAVVEGVRRPGAHLATPVAPVTSGAELVDPSVVKVVMSDAGRALYFSRWPVPFDRDAFGDDPWEAAGRSAPAAGTWWRHLGLYAFRREVLLRVVSLSPVPLEGLEKLEQLRWLAHGVPIDCVKVAAGGLAIDTPADLEAARRLLNRGTPY